MAELPEPSRFHVFVKKGAGSGTVERALRPVRTLSLDDVAAVGVMIGLIGGCVLLGLLVGWFAGVGLFFALLVLWGAVTLHAHRSLELPTAPEA